MLLGDTPRFIDGVTDVTVHRPAKMPAKAIAKVETEEISSSVVVLAILKYGSNWFSAAA